jgi:integrase
LTLGKFVILPAGRIKGLYISKEARKPNWKTVNKELATLRQVFEFARKKIFMYSSEMPVIKNVRKLGNNDDLKHKPSTSDNEITHLLARLVAKYKRAHKLLIYDIAWLCLTGIRVAEAKALSALPMGDLPLAG